MPDVVAIRRSLLELHRQLLEAQRIQAERFGGRMSSGAVLQAATAARATTRSHETPSLSPNTVANHVAGILAKLHVENRIQAAVEAVRSGIC